MFRFMEKYRISILLAVLFAMVGFGIWSFVGDLISGKSETVVSPDDVWATVQVFGEPQVVTQADVWEALGNQSFYGDETIAGGIVAKFIQDAVAESEYGYNVSEKELVLALKARVQTAVARSTGGEFNQKMYAEFCSTAFNPPMTPEQFEAAFMEELRIAKTWREVVRAGSIPPLAKIFERARKDNQLVKLKGIFWDTAQYEEAAKLSRDANDNLTPAAIASLQEYFESLSVDERRALATKGALITSDFFGYDFSRFADDAAFTADFTKINEKSGKSLDQITAEVAVTPEDVTMMKARLAAMRSAYGLTDTDDVEAVYAARQTRFEHEIRIIKHVHALWAKIDAQIKSGQEVDLAQVAADNNFIYFTWKDRFLLELTAESGEFQSSDLYQFQLPSLTEGNLLDLRYPPGTETLHYGKGAVDVAGRHIAVFRLLDREMQPEAKFNDPDVRKGLVTRLEKKRAVDARDAAFTAFESRMDAVMTELAQEKIAEIEAQAATELAELLKDLDPEVEADQETITQTTADKAEETELLIEEAKAEHRAAAFKKAFEEMPNAGLVVEEGFFRPADATREQPADREASFEVRARSSLRREFRGLHDDSILERVVEPGEVSDVLNSPSNPGLKGIATLVAKKTITDRALMLRPELLKTAFQNAVYARSKEMGKVNLLDYQAMQERNFDLDPGRFVEKLAEEAKKKAEAEQRNAEFEAELKRRNAERANSKPDAAAPDGTRSLSTTPNK